MSVLPALVPCCLHEGDALSVLSTLPAGSVQTCVTSPPYWGLRNYGHEGQLGLESTPEEYVANLVEVFREVRRVLRDDGTLWLNLGDSYAGSWGNQGRKEKRGTQRPINGGMLTPVHDGRYPSKGSNTGTCPPGLKPKDLVGIPWRVAFALQADGWWLRSDIIWSKPNPMPESITDRPTKAHEYLFLLTKSQRYHYDQEAVREPHAEELRVQSESRRLQRMSRAVAPVDGLGQSSKGIDNGKAVESHTMRTNPAGRNKRSVWTVTTKPFAGAHFAVMPTELVDPCIRAGCPQGGTVLDPFTGSGTVGVVAMRNGRSFIGIELNPDYARMAKKRLRETAPLFFVEVEAGK